ncbi:YezD family protein [Bacillus altitudinis]|uniref:YezD family protein n=1 Tax=Bacillus altitudinis TaxID=293387 RepID=UPI001F60FABB|nr:YezD family protein [Bacillus altitudinis]
MDEQKLNFILSALKGIEYGSVVITIHNGQITQIDTTEKTRFPAHQENLRIQKAKQGRYRS